MTDTETMHDQTPSAQAGADRMTPDGSTFMRVLGAGMLALALGLAVPALAQEDQDQAAQESLDVEEVQDEIDEAFETISEYSADQRGYSTACGHLFHAHVASHSMTCGHPREVICEAVSS